MKNELLHIGGITVYGYGLMIAVAILSAYTTVEWRAKKKGLEYEKIYNLTIWCAVGGLLGARLLYLITILPEIIDDPSELIKNWSGGFVVYGGIIAGILCGGIYCKIRKWNFFEYFDLTMPSIALAQGFGRIGCFLAGCCYGKETDSWFSITFHDSDLAPNGVPLIPTQLLSSGLDFLNCVVLLLLSKRNKVKGVIAGCYLMFYSAGRFVIEFFRGDVERGSVGKISTSQFISLFLFVIGAAIVVIRVIQAKKANVLPEGTEKETIKEAEKDKEAEEDEEAEEDKEAEEDEETKES